MVKLDLEKLVNDPDIGVRRNLTMNLSCPTHILKKLADEEDYAIRSSIVTHPNATIEVLEVLLNNKRSGIGNIEFHIAGLEKPLSEEIYFYLATNEDSFIRAHLALNRQIPEKVLFFLVKDYEPAVRSAVARNPNVSKILLQQLAKDKSYVVRCSAASLYPSKDDVLIALLNDSSPEVRQAIIGNNKIAFEHKINLIHDSHPKVRAAALKHEDCPVELLQKVISKKDLTLVEVFSILQNKRTPVSDYQNLLSRYNDVKSFDYQTMKSVASNPHTPESILFLLAENIHDMEISAWLMSNPNASIKLLIKFLKHPKSHLRKIALAHPNLPEPMKRLANLFSL